MALIVAGPDRHLFVLVVHHSISDGSSVKILIDELSAVYRAETAGVPTSLPPLVMEYGDYAEWQQDLMQGEELDRQLSYWREQLRGAPRSLRCRRPARPTRQSSRGGVATIYVDAATTERLAAVAHAANATLFMLFLTGFAATLSRYARQADLLLGTEVTDRTHAELDPLIGMFTNILALRISLADDPTFAELLGRVRDTTVDGLAHRAAPVREAGGGTRTGSHARARATHPGPVRLRAARRPRWIFLVSGALPGAGHLDRETRSRLVRGCRCPMRCAGHQAFAGIQHRPFRCGMGRPVPGRPGDPAGTRRGRSWHSGSRPADAIGGAAR